MSNDDYVKAKGILVHISKDAAFILFDMEAEPEEADWVPLSLIHSADLRKLTWDNVTEIIEIRLFEWKAKELGLD